jgi:hypothetical protein
VRTIRKSFMPAAPWSARLNGQLTGATILGLITPVVASPPFERSGLSDQLRDNHPRHPGMPVDNIGRISAGEARISDGHALSELP